MISPRRKRWAVLLAVGVLAAIGVYATAVEPNSLRLKRITLQLADLPKEVDGLVIAHLADLHIHRLGRREGKVQRFVEEDPPDILVITGDFVSDIKDREECLEFLGGLEAKLGIWAVQGNWEHYTDWTGNRLREDLRAVNISLLINEAEHLQVDGEIWIAGTDDPSLGEDRLSRTLAGTEGGFVVLLAHSPEIMNRAPEGVSLILSGHTHGGQVRLPLIGAPWGRQIGGGYIYGVYESNGTIMHVTRGVGMAHLPIRFLCPPEIVYITLRCEGS